MKTEKTLAIVFVVGLIMKMLHWNLANEILIISLGTMALLYFPAAFYFFSDKVIKQQNLALSIVAGIFLSIIPMGVLYKILDWAGAETFLLIGAISAPIILAIVFFLKNKTADELKTYYQNMFLRTTILTALAIAFYLTPASAI